MKRILLFLVITFCANLAFSQFPSYAPTQDLLAFYSFSGNILDNSGNGHNNANYNIVSTTDRFNTMLRALYFSGSGSEYLNYGDEDDFEGWVQLSYSFWILPEAYGGASSNQLKPIITKWAGPSELSASSYNIVLNNTDLCLILSDGTTTDTLKAPLNQIMLNQWSHVVITTNYGFVKIYINNVLLTDTTTTISAINNTASDFQIGSWYYNTDPTFSSFLGKIDDVGLWNRELSECEVDALYTGTNCPTASLENLTTQEKELIKIVDLMGREIPFQPNTPQIYIYMDGTVEKRIVIE